MSLRFNELGINTSLTISCPKCRTNDIVVKIEETYYKFYRCNGCGLVNEKLED